MKKILVITFLFLPSCGFYNEIELSNVCVKDKTLAYSHNSSQYRIYTNNEVFAVSDSLVKLRFNSSDIYGTIESGKCYDIVVYGKRVPFFGMYRNILDVKKTQNKKTI
jgi:hypothetical protein